jgi:hypothetical protein
MSQTILIETNPELNHIFSLNLKTFVGTDVIVRKNADDTLALLKILPQINLIITETKVGEEETALKIFDFLKKEKQETALIVLGDCPLLSKEKDVTCLPNPVSWETLINQSAKLLGVTLQEVSNQPKPDYLPVSLTYFNDIQETPCDVYIRIKKGPGQYQFVKRIHQKDVFEPGVIDKYAEQGLKEFYVQKDYIQYFTTYVTNVLVKKLERQDLTMEDRILATAHGHEIVRERIQMMELDQACIDLSDASVHSMIKSVKNSPEVANLIKFLFSNKVSFAYQNCHLLSLMCHYILSRQSWYKPDHLEILSFVSFFSDVTLKSQQQMQISSLKELAESSLTEEEKNQVMNHAADAAEILSARHEFNEYTRTVLLQSHGQLDGRGFAENPSEELHPLSKVFIIADTFVKTLLNPKLPSSKKDILPLLYQRFTNPSYQKIIMALEHKFQS